MLIGMAAQGAATYCMFKYRFLRTHIQNSTLHAAHVHNSDIEAAAILSMIFPCIVLLLFNAEYFVLLFWPARTYSARYLAWKKAVFVLATFGMFATVVISTVVVAMQSASITGVDEMTVQQLTELYFRPPLKYRSWAQNIVWLVLLWIAVAVSVASTTLLLMAIPQERKRGQGESKSSNKKIPQTTPGASADAIINPEGKEKSIVSAGTEEV
ncbi:hypothetical protein BJ912DRAFT_245589 [Pholiota molesta]|nr:hypothetical protein BJ912DRAFT_245589 [Pholiota molesta]